MDTKAEGIERAKELLQTVRHAAMATVNADGTPHNSPLLFLHNAELTKLYWGSHPESAHSQNILRTGQSFVVVYDANKKGGLYISTADGHITEGDELDEALAVHNAFRIKEGKSVIEKSYYQGASPQKMWTATITGLWINGSERNEDGLIIRDYREEVTAEKLLER